MIVGPPLIRVTLQAIRIPRHVQDATSLIDEGCTCSNVPSTSSTAIRLPGTPMVYFGSDKLVKLTDGLGLVAGAMVGSFLRSTGAIGCHDGPYRRRPRTPGVARALRRGHAYKYTGRHSTLTHVELIRSRHISAHCHCARQRTKGNELKERAKLASAGFAKKPRRGTVSYKFPPKQQLQQQRCSASSHGETLPNGEAEAPGEETVNRRGEERRRGTGATRGGRLSYGDMRITSRHRQGQEGTLMGGQNRPRHEKTQHEPTMKSSSTATQDSPSIL
ncbi:hypothetical protein THAOC_28957, partial [Thalassiosira oceanica]